MWRSILKFIINFKRKRYMWFLSFSFFVSLVLVLIINYKTGKDYSYKIGDFAKRDIKANQAIEIEDKEATVLARNEAESRTAPTYDYDSEIYNTLEPKIESVFKLMKSKQFRVSYQELRKLFEEQISRVVPDTVFKVFYVNRFSWRFKKLILYALKTIPKRYIIADRKTILPHGKTKELIISDIHKEGDYKDRLLNAYFVNRSSLTVNDVYEIVVSDMQRILKKFSLSEQDAIKSFIKTLIIPNLTYNSDKTNINKKKNRESVKKSIIKINKGEIIVRDGDSIERQHLLIFEALREANKTKKNLLYYSSQFFIFFLAFFVISFYVLKYSTMNLHQKDLWFIGVSLILYTLLLNGWIFFIPFIRERFINIPDTVWLYLFPFILPVILAKVMLNVSSTSFISVLSAVVLVVLVPNSLLPVYVVVSGFTVDVWIRNITSRISLLKKAVPIFFFQAMLAYVVGLLGINSLDFTWFIPLYMALFGVLSGFASIFFAEILVPLFESSFRYTSNLKLLEFANFNHPLLRKLIINAPGTYQHSIGVGQLASEAAQAIGANALLTRVGAYFHDIGKLKNPEYYIENQRGNNNPHDKKSPEESREILQEHINYGIELAKKYRLGREITYIIEQHHGNSVMKFFYHKALKIGMDVKEKDFRYRGPRPQSKESVLVMIADSVEAISRTLEDFSRPKVIKMIDEVVKDMFRDGQFDETDISPKKLRRIVQIYTKVVIAMNHNRIKYENM